MNFRVRYRNREILNVLHYFTLSILRALYGSRKAFLWLEDKIVYCVPRAQSGLF